MSEIICRNLSIGYNNKAIRENLNFSIPTQAYTCIVGENGSGKTTLMRTILGLLPPLAGNLEFHDLLPTDLAYLPQQSLVQKDFPASVREVVLSGCLKDIGWRPFYTRKEKEKASEAMDKLQIRQLEKCSYRELSGGQQQRVLLARALCAANKVLFLDEPTAGLDPNMTAELYDLIYHLHEDGMGIIMITHDLLGSLARADYVLELQDEEVKLSSSAEYLSEILMQNKELYENEGEIEEDAYKLSLEMLKELARKTKEQSNGRVS